MSSKYKTLKTTDIGAGSKWLGVVSVDNVRTYPKTRKQKK